MINDETTPELEQDVNENQTEETIEETQEESSTQTESTSKEDDKDWKAEALKYKAILDRNKNKKPESKTSTKSDELDYAQKAYLTANGLKGKDEHALALEYAKNTGKSLDDVVENKYFLNDLTDLREKRATKNAMPSSSKRPNNSSKEEVDYWISKGDLPPATEVELRRKVVNERIKRESKTNVFLP